MTTMVRRLITLPVSLNKRLEALKDQGYTASGFIRHLLERELTSPPKPNGKGHD